MLWKDKKLSILFSTSIVQFERKKKMKVQIKVILKISSSSNYNSKDCVLNNWMSMLILML